MIDLFLNQEVTTAILTESVKLLNRCTRIISRQDKLYRQGKEELSDKDFDIQFAAYNDLYDLTDEYLLELTLNPRFQSTDVTPTLKKGKIDHVTSGLLGTLTKANSITEVIQWFNKIKKLTKHAIKLVAELKYDGNSVSSIYAPRGEITTAFSRGKDGKGEDFMKHFSFHKIASGLCKETIEIRYEAVMTDEKFELVQAEEGLTFANNRSAVGGILNSDRHVGLAEKYIDLVPLDVVVDGEMLDRYKMYELLDKMFGADPVVNKGYGTRLLHYDNFEFAKGKLLTPALLEKELTALYDTFNNGKRFDYNVMVDGLVIKVANADAVNDLGYVKETPVWATALKFDYLEGVSKVVAIHSYFGKSGRITPVVEYEPIKFLGAVQTHTSLANYKRYLELDLAVGDEIRITYRNDVISYVEEVVKRSKNDAIEIEFDCPKCGDELYLTETETFLFCANDECPGVILGKIEKFCVGTGMLGVRYKTLEKIFNEDVIATIPDLYTNQPELRKKLAKIASFHQRSVDNFMDSINAIKGLYDYQVFGSLSIEGIGRSRFKDLFTKYTVDEFIGRAETLEEADFIKEITEIKGFSKILATRLSDNIMDVIDVYDEISEFLEVKDYKADVQTADKPEVFVITGELANMDRNEAKKQLELKGHKVTGSVSKNTTYLVTNDQTTPTVKLKKARELSVPIIDEETLFERFLN